MLFGEALTFIIFKELLSAELKTYKVYNTAILSRFKVLLLDILKGAYLVFIDKAIKRGTVLLRIKLLMLSRIVKRRLSSIKRRVSSPRLRVRRGLRV